MNSARHRNIFEQPNRRLRNRMSGGVRGRGLVTPSYSINFRRQARNYLEIGEVRGNMRVGQNSIIVLVLVLV